jgi:hypothetical protein
LSRGFLATVGIALLALLIALAAIGFAARN